MRRILLSLALFITCLFAFSSGNLVASGHLYQDNLHYFSSSWVGLFEKTGAEADPVNDTLLGYNQCSDGEYLLDFLVTADAADLYIAGVQGDDTSVRTHAAIMEKDGTPLFFDVEASDYYPELYVISGDGWLDIDSTTAIEHWYMY